MIWLLKKLVSLGILVGVVLVVLQLDYKGRPVRDYVTGFFKTPLVQELIRQGKDTVLGYLNKDVRPNGPAMEKLSEKERKELEKVLEKELEKSSQ